MEKYHCPYADECKKNLPESTTITDLSNFFKVFSEPTRLKILFTILEKELCVHDITTIVGMEQSAVSHQLKFLRQAKLVKANRHGRNVFYQLDDDHVHKILTMGLTHLKE